MSELINRYDRYVQLMGNRWAFLPPMGKRLADPQGASTVQEAVNQANEQIVTGVAKGLDTSGEAYSFTVPAETVTFAGSHDGFNNTWYDWELWLDRWASGKLAASLALGTGAAALTAELTSWTGIGALSGGAIAAILAIRSAGAWPCERDNGMGIHLAFRPVTVTGCWPQ
ncbi:hypothetical protein KEM60_02484 [Austwickia sp. TVS 96-490-7B]|uniref:hypothetical protein n=1 Tax=Austwickia sp. TVS 96-490-7B TaxID=2830843 RepID=UPI001C5937E9|nr:hypothetical protein [Austwickia sp. TVS 96-490-7B]MBW3086272.1 hypothetical protein [Austwickia sp. TVS 96-490-7B]